MAHIEHIQVAELHRRFRAQGVASREHIAFRCPMCGTVQSIASLTRAGAHPDRVESFVGFSCEGRLTNAGPWPAPSDKTRKAAERRQVRGCDWTLGGLLPIHRLSVTLEDGSVHPTFEVATSEEAKALEAAMTRDEDCQRRVAESPLG